MKQCSGLQIAECFMLFWISDFRRMTFSFTVMCHLAAGTIFKTAWLDDFFFLLYFGSIKHVFLHQPSAPSPASTCGSLDKVLYASSRLKRLLLPVGEATLYSKHLLVIRGRKTLQVTTPLQCKCKMYSFSIKQPILCSVLCAMLQYDWQCCT